MKRPYCTVLGLKFKDRFEPTEMIFYSEEEFMEYCDTLREIFDPHERPRIICARDI